MPSDGLECLLEDVEWHKELAVRRYLSDTVEILQEKLDERPDVAVGGIRFNPSNMGSNKESNRYGKVASFLSENTDYVEKFRKYRIEPDKITDLKEQLDNVDLYPTVEEEEQLVRDILADDYLQFGEVKEKLTERVNYEPSRMMVKHRLGKISEAELEGGEYSFDAEEGSTRQC